MKQGMLQFEHSERWNIFRTPLKPRVRLAGWSRVCTVHPSLSYWHIYTKLENKKIIETTRSVPIGQRLSKYILSTNVQLSKLNS